MTDKIRCATVPYPAESEFTELVRDNERLFLERMLPLVERRCVALDFHTVKRIDAAGLGALIRLLCAAREAGHTFTVSNPTPRVREILALVGLGRILESQDTGKLPYFSTQFEEAAA